MSKKIVFFDIDGTLLNHQKVIPDSTKKAVKQLQENGVFVAIATGRAPFMFENIRKELDIESFISINGQFVLFENEVLSKTALPTDEIERLNEQSRSLKIPLVFLNEKTMKANVHSNERIEEAMSSLKFPHPEFDDTFYLENEIFQVLMFCTEDEEHHFMDQYDQFRLIRWHKKSVDVLPIMGSKAEGIKQFIKKAGFEMEDVYAFGDGLNDIEMLQAAGTGVAMGNASDEVKQHADVISDSVDEDGIFNGLTKLGLI
ncbi:Cof-type HAD-IIB family hydrolase [Peribacillus alkalitolerans]|uniref:Cof-type HAD-IIB family hydrolase n=1 Tax=Peribacillus alkalitolerans TaxID=1550385 RepID=UPI0013D4A69A|nr:Cof-type HAD-IIB family hydrolase [Peribacillus alkalitolerans]